LSDTYKQCPAGLYIEPMKKRQQHGFTLYELLTTIMIIGVIMAIGVPNMAEFTQNSRLTSTSNDMLASFYIARSEAARSKSNITICASANSLDPAAACGGTFNDGWIIFVDLNGDLVHDAPAESIVKAFPPVATGVVITTAANATYFAFFRRSRLVLSSRPLPMPLTLPLQALGSVAVMSAAFPLLARQ